MPRCLYRYYIFNSLIFDSIVMHLGNVIYTCLLASIRKPINAALGVVGSEPNEVDPKGKAVLEEPLTCIEWGAEYVI